jgi:aspartyl-tRNA(Asn)/glutamyl-tRNA(Gln) amidotransferase subunit C
MEFTPSDVRRIARLARIAVSDEEAESMRGQLTAILALIQEMQAVDTAGIEPMAHAQDLVLRLREDRVTEADCHEAFQQIAPAAERGLYLVPKVIE